MSFHDIITYLETHQHHTDTSSPYTSLSGRSSFLVLQRYSQHYTASDVLALGKGGIALINALRPRARRHEERQRAQMPSLQQKRKLPSADLLLSDLTSSVLDFLNSHLREGQGVGWKPTSDDEKFVNYTLAVPKQESEKSRL